MFKCFFLHCWCCSVEVFPICWKCVSAKIHVCVCLMCLCAQSNRVNWYLSNPFYPEYRRLNLLNEVNGTRVPSKRNILFWFFSTMRAIFHLKRSTLAHTHTGKYEAGALYFVAIFPIFGQCYDIVDLICAASAHTDNGVQILAIRKHRNLFLQFSHLI